MKTLKVKLGPYIEFPQRDNSELSDSAERLDIDMEFSNTQWVSFSEIILNTFYHTLGREKLYIHYITYTHVSQSCSLLKFEYKRINKH